jgi:hypothetical protein
MKSTKEEQEKLLVSAWYSLVKFNLKKKTFQKFLYLG